MRDYLPFLVIGISAGSIYGIAAMGLVLTYKTSGILNFAHGAIAAAAAYVFFELRQRNSVPWPLAVLIAVVLFGIGAGFLMERLAERLAKVPTAFRIVATVGLLVAIRALLQYIFGTSTLIFRPFLPNSEAASISGVSVTWGTLITLGLGILSALALYLLFRFLRIGKSMLAVVDDPDLLDLTGQSPTTVRRASWMIGCTFAAASGVLFASTQQSVDATLLSLLIVQAFGAAAIGAFTNLPMAFAGGIAVGMLQAIASKHVASDPVLQGLDTNVPFLVLFFGLLIIPRRRLLELGQPVKARIIDSRPMAMSLRLPIIGAVVLAALVLPHVVGSRLPLWSTALSQVLLYASLGLLVRNAGQISLSQVGFAAVGGAWFSIALDAGVPWGIALLGAGLVAVPIGAIVAIPAIRLSGVFLGLGTLGFGILLAQFAYTREFMFGSLNSRPTARPHVFGLDSDVGYYHVLLGVTLVGLFCVAALERSRLGRLLRGLADSPLALSTLGTNANVTKVLIFCLSSFLAGISGGLFGGLFGSLSGEAFNFFNSIVILAVLVIAGRSTVIAAIIAPVLAVVVPGYIGDSEFELLLQVMFGLTAIVVALLSQTDLAEVLAGGTRVAHARDRAVGTTQDRVEAIARRTTGAGPPQPLGLSSLNGRSR